MKGLIFDIKRFAVHDGPGIRTTVFFKGCPLKCVWCHNPESRSCEVESYTREDRIGRREFTSEKLVGKYYSVEELLVEVEKDRVFYNESKGGITCSGGEPLYQPEFLKYFLKACKEQGLHTAVDTSGYADWDKLERVLPYTDVFLYDLKHLEPKKHKKFTGVENETILLNLEKLMGKSAKVQIRYPLIPGFNDSDEHINQLIQYLNKLSRKGLPEINILPYHDLGISKYKKFNLKREDVFIKPDKDKVQEIAGKFKENNFHVTIGG